MDISPPDRATVKRNALTLVFAGLGGLVALTIGLPAAMLVGGAVGVALASLSGLRLGLSQPLVNTGLVIMGMAFGTNVAPNTLELIPQWPVTLIVLVISLTVVVTLTGHLLHRYFGLDRTTAYLAAIPGHLSMVLGMAGSGYGDMRRIVIIQSMRVLLLTLFVPLVALVFGGPDMGGGVLARAPMALGPLGVLTLACVAGGLVFTRVGVPAGLVIGGMIVAVAGKLGGLYEGVLPEPVALIGFTLMGALVGSRMSGITPGELRESALAGLLLTGISIATVSAAAWACTLIVPMPFGQIWLGLAPGALEAMAALGLALGFDSAFIAAHNTLRLIVLGIAIPTLPAWLARHEGKSS